MRLLEKLKKSFYSKDKLLLKLIHLFEKDVGEINLAKKNQIPTRVDYVEKREIDRSTLYSFNCLFQLHHTDIVNVELLGKSATTPNYALLIVDIYSSKVYVYPMRSRKQLLQRLKKFYDVYKTKEKIKT